MTLENAQETSMTGRYGIQATVPRTRLRGKVASRSLCPGIGPALTPSSWLLGHAQLFNLGSHGGIFPEPEKQPAAVDMREHEYKRASRHVRSQNRHRSRGSLSQEPARGGRAGGKTAWGRRDCTPSRRKRVVTEEAGRRGLGLPSGTEARVRDECLGRAELICIRGSHSRLLQAELLSWPAQAPSKVQTRCTRVIIWNRVCACQLNPLPQSARSVAVKPDVDQCRA